MGGVLGAERAGAGRGWAGGAGRGARGGGGGVGAGCTGLKPPRSRAEGPGPWNLPAWGPRPPWGHPPDAPKADRDTNPERVEIGGVFSDRPRTAGGLGRSLERPCKWSAALSAA